MIGYIPTAILNLCVQCFVSTGQQKCAVLRNDMMTLGLFVDMLQKMKNITGLFVVENDFRI